MNNEVFQCFVCTEDRPMQTFIPCVCRQNICTFCLFQIVPVQSIVDLDLNEIEILTAPHTLPCPFCCGDLTAKSDLAKLVAKQLEAPHALLAKALR